MYDLSAVIVIAIMRLMLISPCLSLLLKTTRLDTLGGLRLHEALPPTSPLPLLRASGVPRLQRLQNSRAESV